MSKLRLLPVLACLLLLQACITRSTEVRAVSVDAAEFAGWSCIRIDDELDGVQHRAADVAYSVDAQAGNNILALGLGVMVFWPAMLAMRPDGLEAADLARLKGRFDALSEAARRQGCPPPGNAPSVARAATLSLLPGERLVYEDRRGPRGSASGDRREWVLQVDALRRSGLEYTLKGSGRVRQDHSGNIVAAPDGELAWPHLLRHELRLGAVTAGDIVVAGDPFTRARMRGQVVAVGPQTVAGRRFDVAVVELFGDTEHDDGYTRVDGAIVVDRNNGVLLRLDLRSAEPGFRLQRRLVRVEPVVAAPVSPPAPASAPTAMPQPRR